MQDGYNLIITGTGYRDAGTRAPRFVWIDNPNTKECQYTQSKKTNADPRCLKNGVACKWKTDKPTLEQ